MAESCRGELALRGRAGMLTPAGQSALEAHLAECESCRADQRLLADLDRDSVVDVRDGARLERLAVAARAWAVAQGRPARGTAPPARRSAWVAAAVLSLLAGTGAAGWWMARSVEPVPIAPRASVAPPGAPLVPADVPGSPAVAPGPPAMERAPAPLRSSRPALRASAATLLRQAGEARWAGDAARAVALYRKLVGDFAGSPEALLARVPLGGLLLERGRTREALVELERYLDVAPSGALAPEALYGRARSLAAMGRREEARRTWERLLRDYPDSAYAPLARRRSAEAR